jgi:beta-N-acetylhexosaminidase
MTSFVDASLGQLFFTGISGQSLTEQEKVFIASNNIGGVVLFARNIAEPKQLKSLCDEIQSLSHQQKDKVPLFIGIDQEGGRVARLRAPFFTSWPAVAQLGAADNPTVTFDFAHDMGKELFSLGINLNFAPCVDVLTNPANKAIGDRAISSDVAVVEKHASALVRGYLKAGLLTSAKHFPGHGNTVVDSHDVLPIEQKNLQELSSLEFGPFKKAIRARTDMIMVAHLLYPQVDPHWPSSLSEIFMKQILREQLRFSGLVITDDLGMGALVKNYATEEIAVRALEAGADLLLYCNDFSAPPLGIEAVQRALSAGRLSLTDLESRARHVIQVKGERLAKPCTSP